MKWVPPIPGGKLTSKPVRDLGSAVVFLHWCYEAVRRDGTIEFQINDVAGYLEESYYTVRKWWSLVKDGPWFAEVTDRGKLGFRVRMADDWIEWRIFNSPSSNDQMHDYAFQSDEIVVNSFSNENEMPNRVFQAPAYKVLHDDHEAPPPPPARAEETQIGGGGGATREGADPCADDPLYALFVSPRYGILNADRLMPQWAGQDVERVRKLLERLYRQSHDPTKPQYTGGRLYRALQAGPAALFAPVAQSPPPAPSAQSPPVAVLDVRTAAARLTEKRYGHTKPHDPD